MGGADGPSRVLKLSLTTRSGVTTQGRGQALRLLQRPVSKSAWGGLQGSPRWARPHRRAAYEIGLTLRPLRAAIQQPRFRSLPRARPAAPLHHAHAGAAGQVPGRWQVGASPHVVGLPPPPAGPAAACRRRCFTAWRSPLLAHLPLLELQVFWCSRTLHPPRRSGS